MRNFIKNNMITVILFILFFVPCAGDALIVLGSAKHGDANLNKYWISIEISDDKIYRHVLPFTEWQEAPLFLFGEKVIVQNERRQFDHQGFSMYDLVFPKLDKTLLGVTAKSSSIYTPVHEGREVHAIFEMTKDPIDKSVTFKIEDGNKFKVYLNKTSELDEFQNGDEFDILHEESVYEENPWIALGIKKARDIHILYKRMPLLILIIKNLSNNKEYTVKADAINRWKYQEEDRCRVMTLEGRRIVIQGTKDPRYPLAEGYERIFVYFLKSSYNGFEINAPVNNDFNRDRLNHRMIILERLGSENYKILNLNNGELYNWHLPGLNKFKHIIKI